MSRLDRFRAGLSRMGTRMSAYRAAAMREQERRVREGERILAEEEGLPARRPGGGVPETGFEARTRHAVLSDIPLGPPPPAAGPVGGTGGRPPEAETGLVSRPGRPAPAEVLPWGVRVAGEAAWRFLVLAAVVWVLVQVVGAISLLVMAFVAGLLITALLQPFVGWLKQVGLNRGAATAIASVCGFAVMGLIGWFVVWQVMENVDRLVEQIQAGIEDMQDWVIGLPGVTEDNLEEWTKNLNNWISDNSSALTSAGLEGVNYVVQFFSGAGVTLFVVLFLLYDGRGVWYWFLKLVPANARDGVAGAGPRAWITLTGYVRGTVIVALIDAIGIGLGLLLLNVPMAVPLAVIVFLSAFVPIVGAIASGALAVLVAFVTNGFITAAAVLGVVLLVQQIESQILQPFILGRLVRVHPLAVVLAVTGGTLLAGIPGAIVAVPLIAVLNTVVGYLRAYQNALEHTGRISGGATVAPLAPTLPPTTDPGAVPGAESPADGGSGPSPGSGRGPGPAGRHGG